MQINLFAEETQLQRVSESGASSEKLNGIDFEAFRPLLERVNCKECKSKDFTQFAMLSRPSDNGHTPFGDIFYSDSQDLEYRGHHHHVNEQVGDVPIVVFPCAALCDAATGRLTVYYGGADTVVCMAHTTVDTLIDFVKENSY